MGAVGQGDIGSIVTNVLNLDTTGIAEEEFFNQRQADGVSCIGFIEASIGGNTLRAGGVARSLTIAANSWPLLLVMVAAPKVAAVEVVLLQEVSRFTWSNVHCGGGGVDSTTNNDAVGYSDVSIGVANVLNLDTGGGF